MIIKIESGKTLESSRWRRFPKIYVEDWNNFWQCDFYRKKSVKKSLPIWAFIFDSRSQIRHAIFSATNPWEPHFIFIGFRSQWWNARVPRGPSKTRQIKRNKKSLQNFFLAYGPEEINWKKSRPILISLCVYVMRYKNQLNYGCYRLCPFFKRLKIRGI